MRAYGPYVAARILRDGPVRTVRGVDRLTGIPVLLYLLPARDDALSLPELDHPHLLPYSDAGRAEDAIYVTAALPLASEPARDPRQLARHALEALAWLHERGLVHGGLTPEQLWTLPDGVSVAGAGLPWQNLGDGYDPPEGGKTAAGDLYTLARSLHALKMLPAALEPLAHPDPARRGTARDALVRLDTPTAAATPVPVTGDLALTAPALVATEPAPNVPSGSSLQATGYAPARDDVANAPAHASHTHARNTEPADEPNAPQHPRSPSEPSADGPILIDAAFDAPIPVAPPHTNERPQTPQDLRTFTHRAPAQEGAPDRPSDHTRAPQSSPRQQPIRIGWEEDHTWRVVKTGPEPARPVPRRVFPWWAVLIAVPILLIAAYMALRPGEDAAKPCCTVTFRVQGAGDPRASLILLKAPGGSNLRVGQELGVAPGEITFPNQAGVYEIRVQAKGYDPGVLSVKIPQDNGRVWAIDLQK